MMAVRVVLLEPGFTWLASRVPRGASAPDGPRAESLVSPPTCEVGIRRSAPLAVCRIGSARSAAHMVDGRQRYAVNLRLTGPCRNWFSSKTVRTSGVGETVKHVRLSSSALAGR